MCGPDNADPPGITRTRARERAARISHVVCDLTLRIPEDQTQDVDGLITIRFTLRDATTPLVLDFAAASRLISASVNGQTASVGAGNGHLSVPSSDLTEGINTLAFEFIAGGEGLHRQNDLLYSLFVPARASHVFPCFDQPDIKARWTLTVEAPTGWRAVSNGSEASHTTLATHERYQFAETPPLPTYLLAIAAGRFAVETVACGERTFRVFHRDVEPFRLGDDMADLADLHARSLSWLEAYTAIPYPFDTFDIVLIPSFQFGGMEHPGAVYYNADLVLLDTAATQLQQLNRANVIAHETAHMWFGNLVTMTWFDDVWMKEVLANFMAAKIVNPWFPKTNHDLLFLTHHYPAAYDVDRTMGAHSIRQPLDNLDDAGSVYGPIIYLKSPIVFRQLEMLMGADALRDALREYLRTYTFGNADWTELLAILTRHTTHDLAGWSHAWIDEAGRPTLFIERARSEGGALTLTLRQTDPLGLGRLWPQRIKVLLGSGMTTRTVDVALGGAAVPVAALDTEPDWILPSGGGLAYGAAVVDTDTLTFLTQSASTITDPLTRTAAFITMWDAMLDGHLHPARLFDMLLTALSTEPEEATLQLLLDQTRATFWRFIPAAGRSSAADRLEPVLRGGLARAASTREKAAWFTTLRSVALTPSSVEWLEAIWSRVRYVQGLPLSDVDETALALDLAVRLPERAAVLLETQIARTSDPDRRARLEFIAPALSADAISRELFSESLREPARRARESWVLDAVRSLHHPLRADESSHLVRPALARVRDVQRTGDIFFPKRWVDATLWGYQSRAVAADVQDFIDGLPADYPFRLRRVLLAAADPLFRAAHLIDR